MSDVVEIRSGGAVAVDTASLRAAAERLEAFRRSLESVRGRLDAAYAAVLPLHGRLRGEPLERIERIAWLCRIADEASTALAGRLRRAATIYEAVELCARRGMAVAAGDAAALWAIDARMAELRAEDPLIVLAAADAVAAWRGGGGELARQAVLGLLPLGSSLALAAGLSSAAYAQTIRGVDRGRIPRGARLQGAAEPVAITRLTSGAGAAPPTLAAATARIPQGDARIRVERYAMPDGSRQFAVYVAGTARMAQTWPGAEPFDMHANGQLYFGRDASSYRAALQALRDAGARPGDVVRAFGHSQGGMIAERLAIESGYDVRTVVTYGSPVQADVPRSTLSVELRHLDEPVAALAGGGSAGPVGAPGSIVVERGADPHAGPEDLGLAAHRLSAYEHTARMLDRSADPRMDAVREVFAELGRATSVEVAEYSATRLSASSAGAG